MQLKTDQLFALFATFAGLVSSVEAAAPSTSGTKFTIDGETAYFAGSNCYWCSFLTNHADIDSTLDNFVSSGLRILRVWGFNDVTQVPGDGTVWFQHLSSSGSTINTGANGLQVLDYLVSSAEERGIKLIIPFVNYWTDYGGMLAYLSAFGGTKQSEWYTNSAAQTQYRKYVSAVVDRYQDSDAIFAWELANEPRCNGCDTDVINDWATSISKFVKSLDPNHMVSLGDEGFGLEGGDGSYPYQYGEGTNFTEHLTIDTLDFGTFHLYPNSWGTSYEWGSDWVKTHAAACKAAGKPCFFEEYGAPSDHCKIEAPWQKTAIETEGIGGDAFWQWGDTISTGQSHNDGNTIYFNSSDWECLVKNHVAAIEKGSA